MAHWDIHSVEEIFSQLSPQDEETIVSLPYRIGLYVSYADVTGGWDAQESELQSLSGILREFSEDFCKSEFTQKVLMETLMQRAKWPSWAKNINTLPDEARKVSETLSAILSEKELHSFQDVLVDIAFAVAMAFHEGREGKDSYHAPQPGLITAIINKIRGKEDNALEHLHISDAERSALLRVCNAMKYKLQR